MAKTNKEHKKKLNENRRLFLLSFFNEEEGYEEKQVNGWWLIKQFDGNYQKWVVHLYSQESYDNYKNGQQKYFEASGGYLDEEFQRLIHTPD